jgi:hypothetical protein
MYYNADVLDVNSKDVVLAPGITTFTRKKSIRKTDSIFRTL